MITLDLIEFIEKAQKKGTTKEIIVSKLLSAGWLQEDINEGFEKVTPLYPRTAPILNIEPKVEIATKIEPARIFVPPVIISPKIEPVNIGPKVEPLKITPGVVAIPKFVESTPSKILTPTFVENKIEPKSNVVVDQGIAPKAIEPVSAKQIEKVEEQVQIKKEEAVKPAAPVVPKVDPYREPAHAAAPVKYQESSSYSLGVNTILPKLWVPSNLPIKVEENTEMIPTLTPKKVEVFVDSKSILPPKYSDERKKELLKVYAAPKTVEARVPEKAQEEIKDILKDESKESPVILPTPTDQIKEVSPVIDPYHEDLVTGQVPAISGNPPASMLNKNTTPSNIEKPPAVQTSAPISPLVKPLIVEVPKNPTYPTLNSAITASYSKDVAKNFIPLEKKPGIPRFLIWMFVFVVIICILGGGAFAYINGLVNIPFLPKVNPISVTSNYVNDLNIVNQNKLESPVESDIEVIDESIDVNSDTSTENYMVATSTSNNIKSNVDLVPTSAELNELKGKDIVLENYMKSLELQIYKKYAINKNSYGTKSNTKGDCLAPTKDSLFYTDPSNISDKTIAYFLKPILDLENNNGFCYSTSKEWAMAFPLATDPSTYMCIDSFGTSINTRNILKSTTCK